MASFPLLKKRKTCSKCGKRVVDISRRGLCYDCSVKAIKDNVKQLKDKKGTNYEKWRKKLLGSLEAA